MFRKLLATLIAAGSIFTGVAVLAPTAAHASDAVTKWKGDCEVVVWAPYRNSSGYVVVPAKFKCGTRHYVKHTENYLMTDKSWAPDEVAAARTWTDFYAAADTWYNLTFTACPGTGATRHVSAGLMISGWSASLIADSPRAYVFC